MVFLRYSQVFWMLALLKQTLYPCYSLRAKNTTCVNRVNPKNLRPQSAKKFVVVFDTDRTICIRQSANDSKVMETNYSECPVIHNIHINEWAGKISDYPHVFLPYLRILFDYLLQNGVRIVFFSSGDDTDLIVLPQLLTSFWGIRKFKALKSEGQFCIFNYKHRREGNFSTGIEGNYVKDLGVVIQNEETLLDAILVIYDPGFSAHDQQPCLIIMNLLDMPSFEWGDAFVLNNIYYMLGVFKTYFEHDRFNKFPLREGVKQILPTHVKDCSSWFKIHPFARQMINVGLLEVQEQAPHAEIYGIRNFN